MNDEILGITSVIQKIELDTFDKNIKKMIKKAKIAGSTRDTKK